MNPIGCLQVEQNIRTLLRQDNADIRLTEKSFRIGLASEERMAKVIEKKKEIKTIIDFLETKSWNRMK